MAQSALMPQPHSKLPRCPSGTSVLEHLEFVDSDCETPLAAGVNSPCCSCGDSACESAPALLEATLAATAAAISAQDPLPPHTHELLCLLFPSTATLRASLPTPSDLGWVSTLLLAQQGAAAPVHPPAGKLATPLPAGGMLCFHLAAAPPPGEQALMEAFCSALADRLRPRPAQQQQPRLQQEHRAGSCPQASLPPPPSSFTPAASCPAALPADCFWLSESGF